mgnify:CR=1 FL=1
MTDQEITAQAIAEWYGPKSRDEIAAEIGITRDRLGHIWKVQKAAGVLPAGCARPFFLSKATPAEREKAIATFGAALPDEDDGDVMPIEPGRDRLLIALKREHGNDPRRAFDNLNLDRRTDRIIVKGTRT